MALVVGSNQKKQILYISGILPFVANALWATIVYAAPPAPAAVADSDANNRYHSSPNSHGLGVEHSAWSFEQINDAIRKNPKAASAWMERGNLYLCDADIEHAMPDFNKAIALDPHCGKAYIGRSRLYQYMKKWPLAFSELQMAVKLAPPGIGMDALFESAFLHKDLGQYPQAIADYDKVLQSGLLSKKRQANAFQQRGETYTKMSKPLPAISDFSSAIKNDPTLLQAHLLRSKNYLAVKKTDLALADLTWVIKSDPEKITGDGVSGFASRVPEAYRARANIYQSLGRPDLAQKDRVAAMKDERQSLDSAPFTLP